MAALLDSRREPICIKVDDVCSESSPGDSVVHVDKIVTFSFHYCRFHIIHSNVSQTSVTYILVSASKRNKILSND